MKSFSVSRRRDCGQWRPAAARAHRHHTHPASQPLPVNPWGYRCPQQPEATAQGHAGSSAVKRGPALLLVGMLRGQEKEHQPVPGKLLRSVLLPGPPVQVSLFSKLVLKWDKEAHRGTLPDTGFRCGVACGRAAGQPFLSAGHGPELPWPPGSQLGLRVGA